MKKALIALAITLATIPAMSQPVIKSIGPNGTAQYWQGDHYLGHSSRSRATGTEMYWPNPHYGQGTQSGCCYNRPFAEGYQMGRDIGTIIRSLSGR